MRLESRWKNCWPITKPHAQMESMVCSQSRRAGCPCDIYNSGTVRGLLQTHLGGGIAPFSAALGEEVTAYDAIPVGSSQEMFAVHTPGGSESAEVLIESR